MPAMSLSVPHKLGKDEATVRMQKLMARLKEKYGDQYKELEETWSEDAVQFAFSSYGMKIKGDLLIGEEAVDLQGEIPFAAMMFKGRIEKEVRETLERFLS